MTSEGSRHTDRSRGNNVFIAQQPQAPFTTISTAANGFPYTKIGFSFDRCAMLSSLRCKWSFTTCGGVNPNLRSSATTIYTRKGNHHSPLPRRNIRKLLLLQHLEQDHIFVSNILNVVSARPRHIPHVAGIKVERPRACRRLVYRHASASLDKERPLIGRGMPVHLCAFVSARVLV